MKTKKTVSMKAVVLLMAVVLLIGCTVGGSLAWLSMKTDTVTNTFSAGGIEIELIETSLDGTTSSNGNVYQLIPGKTYVKDPKVTVKDTTNVDCYLFIKVEQNNAGDFLTYTLNLDDWTKVDTDDAVVYVRKVAALDSNKSWYLLKGDNSEEGKAAGLGNGYVTVKDTLTLGSDMNTASNSYLKFTAYAIQQNGFSTAELAWDEVKKLDSSSSGN